MNNCAWLCSISAKESKAAVKRSPPSACCGVLIFHRIAQIFLELSRFIFRRSKSKKQIQEPLFSAFVNSKNEKVSGRIIGLKMGEWAGKSLISSLLAGRLTATDSGGLIGGDKCAEMGNGGFGLVFGGLAGCRRLSFANSFLRTAGFCGVFGKRAGRKG